jgi:hypothetical protein
LLPKPFNKNQDATIEPDDKEKSGKRATTVVVPNVLPEWQLPVKASSEHHELQAIQLLLETFACNS